MAGAYWRRTRPAYQGSQVHLEERPARPEAKTERNEGREDGGKGRKAMNQSPVGNQQSRHRARAADFELDLAKFESSQATMPYHSCMQRGNKSKYGCKLSSGVQNPNRLNDDYPALLILARRLSNATDLSLAAIMATSRYRSSQRATGATAAIELTIIPLKGTLLSRRTLLPVRGAGATSCVCREYPGALRARDPLAGEEAGVDVRARDGGGASVLDAQSTRRRTCVARRTQMDGVESFARAPMHWWRSVDLCRRMYGWACARRVCACEAEMGIGMSRRKVVRYKHVEVAVAAWFPWSVWEVRIRDREHSDVAGAREGHTCRYHVGTALKLCKCRRPGRLARLALISVVTSQGNTFWLNGDAKALREHIFGSTVSDVYLCWNLILQFYSSMFVTIRLAGKQLLYSKCVPFGSLRKFNI
ncbi:hypothetical protein B0H13DRAFT_1885175 [Mycena leptocephala]|nr:hypothetical protein B0H13DRAFT_1885175 [Mycena leptocephala]